jgi:hypothetical protein
VTYVLHEEVENMLQAVLKAFGKVDVLLIMQQEISFPNRKIICERVWYGYWYRLKGTKNTPRFCKHWIDTKQTSSTVLNIVTTYAWTGSYVVPSATAKRGSYAWPEVLL